MALVLWMPVPWPPIAPVLLPPWQSRHEQRRRMKRSRARKRLVLQHHLEFEAPPRSYFHPHWSPLQRLFRSLPLVRHSCPHPPGWQCCPSLGVFRPRYPGLLGLVYLPQPLKEPWHGMRVPQLQQSG